MRQKVFAFVIAIAILFGNEGVAQSQDSITVDSSKKTEEKHKKTVAKDSTKKELFKDPIGALAAQASPDKILDTIALLSVPESNAKFLATPIISSSQEKGFEFGLAALYSFFVSPPIEGQRNSNLSLSTSTSTKHQSKLTLNANIWTKDNLWHINAFVRMAKLPTYYYGQGNATLESDAVLLNDKELKTYIDIERKVAKNFYIGTGFYYQQKEIWTDNTDPNNIYTSSDLQGKSGGTLTYLPVSLIYDSRDIVNYPHQGWYLKLNVQNSFKALGSDYDFTLTTFDIRTYKKISDPLIFAFQVFGQTMSGPDSPFWAVPQLGSELMMRGYYSGRYRGENIYTVQSELRYRPWVNSTGDGWFAANKFAFTGFAGYGSVFEKGKYDRSANKYNFGGGFRYMFDTKNRQTLRIDYGVGTKEPGEARSKGMYLSFNEAF